MSTKCTGPGLTAASAAGFGRELWEESAAARLITAKGVTRVRGTSAHRPATLPNHQPRADPGNIYVSAAASSCESSVRETTTFCCDSPSPSTPSSTTSPGLG